MNPRLPAYTKLKGVRLLPGAPSASLGVVRSKATRLLGDAGPAFFLPGLLNADYLPLQISQWDVSLWPPWNPSIDITYHARVRSTGLFPISNATLDDLVNAGDQGDNQQLVAYGADLGNLANEIEPIAEFSIEGWDIVKFVIGLIFGGTISLTTHSTISGLGMSKTIDQTTDLPIP